MDVTKLGAAAIAAAVLFPLGMAYGHGYGVDTIPSVSLQGKEATITVELPMYFDEPGDKQITITATDDDTGETVKNTTYLVGLFHDGELVFRDYFSAADGVLAVDAKHSEGGDVMIRGQRDESSGAWYGSESAPLEITGPIFSSGGLYTFEIGVGGVDDTADTVGDRGTHYADLTLVGTTEFFQEDSGGQDVKFRMKSYFDETSNFEYDPAASQVSFGMPFDWSEKRMSHVPVVHVEVHFPKDFAEFLHPGYVGQVNGIDLFKASVVIDDYTESDERIVHFVLLQDHLQFLKNQQKASGEPLPGTMEFTLSASEKISFPLTAFTRSEDFQVDLSWDPVEIEPGQKTNFIFTIRDGSTGDPMRNSDYTFVILQNGKEIHRASGQAQVGGDFEAYEFAEGQTGPTVIRFENIRNSGQETEFGLVVVPEFGSLVAVMLAAGVAGTILLGRRHGLLPRRNCL